MFRFFNFSSRKNVVNNNLSYNNLNIIDNLSSTNNDMPFLTLNNEIKFGYVVDVYDGDTCKINMYFKDEIYRWNCRIMGIDTPELRTKNENEKECGYFVRDKLREKILNKIVIVKCLNFDKYGRLLVNIYEYDNNIDSINNINNLSSINDWLISNNYALPYDGGTKTIKEWNINELK